MTVGAWQLNLFDKNMPWFSVDDRVMGGISQSYIATNDNFELLFLGEMSVKNNGGFASIRREIYLSPDKVPSDAQLKLTVTGDGRTYQVRFRTSTQWNAIAYFARIDTIPNQTVTHILSLDDFKASWRGQAVPDAKPLRWKDVKQMSFMLTDKQPGEFGLLVSDIYWQSVSGV